MNAPQHSTQQLHRVKRIYEIYDRDSRATLGRIEVDCRQDIERIHPWTIPHIKDATEATGSRTGVRFVGERIIRQSRRG